ncbi:TPA: hypothetical protein PXQ43_004025, partial [Yersinia enterocolitica]|nr:hypothetical protein [Yersinia enterocolitica]
CTLIQVSPHESKTPNRKSNNVISYHEDEKATIDIVIIKNKNVIFVAQYNPMKFINLFENNPNIIDPAGIADIIIPTI